MALSQDLILLVIPGSRQDAHPGMTAEEKGVPRRRFPRPKLLWPRKQNSVESNQLKFEGCPLDFWKRTSMPPSSMSTTRQLRTCGACWSIVDALDAIQMVEKAIL